MHPEDAPALKPLSPAARKWVDETFAKLTTEEKIGQVVFPTYFGGFESTESRDYKELMSRVEENHIGGFILATRRSPRGIELSHVYETAVLTNQLQEAAAIPLLIGADFERGTVMRVEEGTAFPHAMAIGATGRPEDAYTMGRITAIEARAIGVHWAFAPVADVNSNPDNPIINIRSFGEDPKRVAEYVAQFVKGVEENGAMATAKHFPGHGDTSTDSHLDLPLVKGDRARLNAVEFVPFESAIGAGVSAVMTGHLAVPALEPNPDIPATLSARVLTGVLRDDLHFSGLVITDALDMGGVTKGFPAGEVAVRALLAGADVLLMSPVTDAALGSVRDAIESGRVPMSRLDEAVHRILEAKARLGLYQNKEVDIENVSAVFRKPEFLAAAQDIADRGVTLLRNENGLIPVDPRTMRKVFLLAVSADPDTTPAEPFEHELRSQLDSLDSLHVDTKYFRVEENHLPPADSYDLAICALTVRVADRKASVGLPANQAEMVHALLRAGKPVIMVGLGSPYLSEGFPEAQTWVSAFSVQDVAQKAAARAVLGQITISGKLPVSLPGAAPHPLRVGDGLTAPTIPLALQPANAEMAQALAPVFNLLEQFAGKDALRGGVLAISYGGREIVRRFGAADVAPVKNAEFRWTLPDVPLLTTAIARLVEVKELSLDTPVATVLQGTSVRAPREGWKNLTVRQVLEHTSGLEAILPASGPAPAESLQYASAVELRDMFPYADAGVANVIVSTLTGQPYPVAPDDMILAPLRQPAASATPAAPAADSMEARAHDALVLGELWLNGGIYAHRRLLSRKTIEQFLAPKTVRGTTYTAGWEMTPAPGRAFSARAYGFTASEGPSLWIDPAHGLCIAFVPASTADPAREPAPGDAHIGPPRAQIHDAIYAALGLKKQP